MADSFSKKENFKKKLQKQKEKALKREERKHSNNKGKSLEDMLVYVDANGQITEVRPDDQEKLVAPHDADLYCQSRGSRIYRI